MQSVVAKIFFCWKCKSKPYSVLLGIALEAGFKGEGVNFLQPCLFYLQVAVNALPPEFKKISTCKNKINQIQLCSTGKEN